MEPHRGCGSTGNREINIVQDNAEEIPEKGICQANIGEYALIGFDQTTPADGAGIMP